MLKWVTSNLSVLLLVALTTVTVGPLIAVWWASRELTWATTLPITSIAALWLGLLYQRNAAIRRVINGVLAAFSSRETLMSAHVRFAVPDDIDYAQITQRIRDYYADSAEASAIRTLEAQHQMDVDVAGWRMRLVLSNLADDELDEGETGGHRDLLISVPETLNSVWGSKRLLSHRILPLLNQIQKDPGIVVQAAQLKIRFINGINPYLSTYFQNVELRSILTLKCVLEASGTRGQVTLAADSITLSAPDLLTLGNLADEHLVMFRTNT